jgi:hypothetical protein
MYLLSLAQASDVQVLLVIDAAFLECIGECDNHRAAAASWLHRCDEAACPDVRPRVAVVHGHQRHHFAKRVGAKEFGGPLIAELKIVENLARNIVESFLELEDQRRERLYLVALVALDDFHRLGLADLTIAEVNGVAEADRGHLDKG